MEAKEFVIIPGIDDHPQILRGDHAGEAAQEACGADTPG
jgi:hypothetical protein